MATATVVRPPQALRRRDAPRPPLGNKRGVPSVDVSSEAPLKKRKLLEPYVRDSQYILRKHKGKPPSLIIHLHPTHFRFDGQDGSFAYDSPMRSVLQHLRLQTVPHDMLDELLAGNVAFHDGCLIVEVHNHRDAEGKKEGAKPGRKANDTKKFSMHNWNPHVTPSPFAPYPSKAQMEPETEVSPEADDGDAEAHEKRVGQEREGPRVTTIVLHPTEQTKHEEMLILARTPASEMKRKKGGDASATVPPTPQLATPPVATGAASRGGPAGSQKMAVDHSELYAVQAEMLVATEPPLFLEPAGSAGEAQAVLDMLAHPLHTGQPPALKERKRTTAEMAADDAQAAEAERRMLIMDERIKPSARPGAGNVAGENQSAAASLGFSRFKTIEVVRQKREEADRIKKEEEARAAQEKRQYEEQMQAQQKLLAQQQKQREMQVREQQQRRQLMQQQQQQELMKHMNAQQAMAQGHAHPGQNNAMQGQQPNSFQHTSAAQGSPVIRQQTPMMPHSSPMVSQSGFPMVPTSSQGAGSPPRPMSAAMHHHGNVSMARGPSQQTQGSRNTTPHIAQGGTPSVPNAIPNRNMSQTPRMGPSSPMVGTPTATLGMPTPRINGNLSTSQEMMLAQMHNANGMLGMQTGSQAATLSSMSPDRVQVAHRMQQLTEAVKQAQLNGQAAQSQGNDAAASQHFNRANMYHAQYQNLRQKYMGGAQHHGPQLAGSPAQAQQTPSMAHAHPNTMQGEQPGQPHTPQPGQQQMPTPTLSTAQQQQMAQQAQVVRVHQQGQQLARHQQELRQIAAQNGGQIPPHVIQTLPPYLQAVLQGRAQQQLRAAQAQVQAQAQAQAQARMGMQMGGQGSPPAGQGTQYMQNMQSLRAGLAMQMGQQQGQNMGGNNMHAMAMNMGNVQQLAQQRQQQAAQRQQQAGQQQQQPGGAGDLSQSFAAMQNALARGQGMQ